MTGDTESCAACVQQKRVLLLDKDILHQIIWEDAPRRRGDDHVTTAAVPVNDSYELCALLRMHTRDSEGLLIAV